MGEPTAIARAMAGAGLKMLLRGLLDAPRLDEIATALWQNEGAVGPLAPFSTLSSTERAVWRDRARVAVQTIVGMISA